MESDDQRWHPGCRQCEVDESVGKPSLRTHANRVSSGVPDQIESIEIAISNVCNLTCKMCGPHASDKWQDLYVAKPEIQKWQFPYQNSNIYTVRRIFDTVDLSSIKSIKYLGGEPFITKEIGELFDLLEERGAIEMMEFACNTNATLFPKKHLDALKRFRSTNIGVSIDGVGDLANYIRTGFSWDRIMPVLEQWAEFSAWRKKTYGSPGVYIATTVQAYNIHQMPELFELAASLDLRLSYHLLNWPMHLALEALPESYLNAVVQRISANPMLPRSIINKMISTTCNPELTKKLLAFTIDADSAMDTRLADVVPELWSSLRSI